VRTKTLVKNAIVQVDATPFKQWYAQHYNMELGTKKSMEEVTPKVEDIKVGRRPQAAGQGRAGCAPRVGSEGRRKRAGAKGAPGAGCPLHRKTCSQAAGGRRAVRGC
jgi:hypothetical protein